MPKSIFITAKERDARIRVLLDRQGWSWYRLAKEMNMNPGSIYRALKYEVGQKNREPSLPTLKRLARALGVRAGFFIDRSI